MATYRCGACGNRTRFDVTETVTSRAHHHFTLAGAVEVEGREVTAHRVEDVSCRWCGRGDAVEVLETAEAATAT